MTFSYKIISKVLLLQELADSNRLTSLYLGPAFHSLLEICKPTQMSIKDGHKYINCIYLLGCEDMCQGRTVLFNLCHNLT